MKVIFLDIDGPMIPTRAYRLPPNVGKRPNAFDQCAVATFNCLLALSGAQFVVSSNWARLGEAVMRETLAKQGVNVERLHPDWTTPRGENSGSWSRGKEVLAWVAAHPEVTHWVSLDDEEIDHPNAVTVTIEDGLLSAHFDQALLKLGIAWEVGHAA